MEDDSQEGCHFSTDVIRSFPNHRTWSYQFSLTSRVPQSKPQYKITISVCLNDYHTPIVSVLSIYTTELKTGLVKFHTMMLK